MIYELIWKSDFIKLKNGDVYLIEEVKNRLVYMVDIKTDEEEVQTMATLDWLVLNGDIKVYCADYEFDE